VTGHTFAGAVHLLHLAGLAWACFSAGGPTTTTAPPAATAAAARAATVLSQGTNAGTVVPAGTTVTLVMHHCPQ
jgi:beta-lactam-binding protein with PASTA domain